MSDLVRGKIKEWEAPDPFAFSRAVDPWSDFRSIEQIELRWEQTYRHSLGKYSKFFLGLEQHQLLATRCPCCGHVWLPPRPACANDLAITKWVELNGRGTLEGFSILYGAPAFIHEETPYVLAYVRLDGAGTLFTHVLRNYTSLQTVRVGLRVQVAFATEAVDHPIRLMWFEPEV